MHWRGRLKMLNRNIKNVFVVMTLIFSVAISQNATATSPSSDWTWPLDGAIVLVNGLHSTTLENTDYDVKNLDLVHSRSTHLTCFDVGWHRLYHAGVDLYLPGGGTEGSPVKSVANGTVVYFDPAPNEQSLIIKHPVYGVWSVYWHLKNVTVSVGNSVQKGQVIGQVTHHDYTGRFPQVHPFNTDDSHLHFEIRTFENGGNMFPNYSKCNTGYLPGVGYTYPDSPDNYGYLDPIQFLTDRIPVVYSRKVFLPVVYNSSSTCQQGENLVQYNAGFEYSLSDPRPWFEASTYFEPAPNLTYYYHIVAQESGVYEGQQNALFGRNGWLISRIVDEQLLQSIRIPANVDTLYWNQYIKLDGADSGDRFFLSLQDAMTGKELLAGGNVEIDHSAPPGQWQLLQIQIYNASALAGRFVSLNYNSIANGDLSKSTMRVDVVELITNCNGYRVNFNSAPANAIIVKRDVIQK